METTMTKERRRTFAVGRVDRKTTEVRIVRRRPHPSGPRLAGPFEVRAVVTATTASAASAATGEGAS